MRKRNKPLLYTAIFITIITASFILFYAGRFLYGAHENNTKKGGDTSSDAPVHKDTEEKRVSPIQHKRLSIELDGNKQEINILEINLASGKVEIKPALSFDSIFGFEKLSQMALRAKAYAAVNGGFFYEYGNPFGMILIDGEMFTKPTGESPVFLIENGKAVLKEIQTELWIRNSVGKVHVDNINTSGKPGEIIVYTPRYGSDNRAKTPNISITIEGGRVAKIGVSKKETQIPKDGMVLTLYSPTRYQEGILPFKEGESVWFGSTPSFPGDAQGYECGSWIVKDGKNVVEKWDPWVGVMSNRDPRTAVGIKDNGMVVLLTVDGRQPGYSAGFTGQELGEFLVDYGVQNAAMLDGGASTEMIIQNKIVNKPSYKGQERLLAGGLMVKLKEGTVRD